MILEKFTVVLPVLMIVESALAGIVYMAVGKWGSATYWFAVCVITVAVTSLIGKYG